MADTADLLAIVLARELVEAWRDDGLRVLAVTSPESLVAGLAARGLGADGLALAVGFGVLDAVDPRPSLTGGPDALGLAGALVSPSSDTFVAVARGMVGVCTTPAQLDARGAVNLSGVGGVPGRPAVALPGSRGLPDNNDMAGPVWYVMPTHAPRQLVGVVDFVSGVAPRPGRRRRLLTPLGVFALGPDGWTTRSLHPGATPGAVAEATGFVVHGSDGAATTPGPTPKERAVLSSVDPDGLRDLPRLSPEDRAERTAALLRRDDRGSEAAQRAAGREDQ